MRYPKALGCARILAEGTIRKQEAEDEDLRWRSEEPGKGKTSGSCVARFWKINNYGSSVKNRQGEQKQGPGDQ